MVLNHVHSYVKWRDRKGWYKCADPKCTSIVPKGNIKGKLVRCSICNNNDVILNKEQLKLSRPRCEACSNTKDAIRKRQLKKGVEKIIGEVFNGTTEFQKQS